MKMQSLSVPGSTKRARSQDSRLDVPPVTPPLTAESSSENMKPPLPGFLNLTKGQIAARFHDLEWKQRFRLAHALQNPNSPWKLDKSSIITARNRYMSIQPWASSRIKLQVSSGQSDYVNASPISLRDSRGNRIENRYIATQGPKDTSHFWHMVFQECQDPAVVVMLTQTHEGPREKCAQYYPLSTSSPTLFLPTPDKPESDSAETGEPPHDPFYIHQEPLPRGTVELLELIEDPKSHSEIRKLRLTIGDQSKTVFHYLFIGWADFGKPEGEDRQALLELIKQTQLKVGDPSRNPRVVHCSAGVGRTGTFIALDYLLKELENGALDPSLFKQTAQTSRSTSATSTSPPSPSLGSSSSFTLADTNNINGQHSSSSSSSASASTPNFPQQEPPSPPKEEIHSDPIYQTVNILREQRMMMVMNELQYSFIYEVLKEAWEAKYMLSTTTTTPLSSSPAASSLPSLAQGQGQEQLTAAGNRATDAEAVQEEGPRSPKMARKISYPGPSDEEVGIALGGDEVDTPTIQHTNLYTGTKVGSEKLDEDTVSD